MVDWIAKAHGLQCYGQDLGKDGNDVLSKVFEVVKGRKCK